MFPSPSRRRQRALAFSLKAFLPAASLALTLSSHAAQIIPVGDSEPAQEAAAELGQWLAHTPDDIGVFIGLADGGDWPASMRPWAEKVKAEDALEAHAVVIEPGERRVGLIGKSHRALDPAIFGFLYDAGFRWYFPGEKWQVIPNSPDLFAGESRIVSPDFRARTFFGTGGFGPRKLAPDPDLEVLSAWRDWQCRNRWGGEVKRVGHAGDDIIHRLADVFEENPDFRAMVDGARVPMDKQFQFSYGNPRFQEWYVNERMDWLRRAVERDPDTLAVSTDPADGGQPHCESPESMALGDGSVSDRVFTLTNLTARALATEFRDRWVAVNAYNRHLRVPSIPLEPNIFVQVIPYAFNRSGLDAEELIEAWGKKHPGRIGIYDYWNITDWVRCEPHLKNLLTIPGRIRYWQENGITSAALESSASIGAMGLQLMIASRLFWDTTENPETLLNEFFATMFGPSEPSVRRMFDRWSHEFLLTPQEIALSYRDLDEAMRLAEGKPDIEARLRDLIGYVFFLQRKLEFEEAWSDNKEDLEPALRFAEAIWAIHPGMMAQSYRMHQLIGYHYYRGRFDETIFGQWDPRDPESPGWGRYSPLSDSDLDNLLKEGLASYPVVYEPKTYALDEFVPVINPEVQPDAWAMVPTRLGRSRFVFRQTGDEKLEVLNQAKEDLPIRVTVRPFGSEDSGERTDIPVGDWANVPVPTEPGLYEILMRPMGTLHHDIRSTPGALLTEIGDAELRQPPASISFYVPKGQTQIALHTPAPAPGGIKLFDGDGNAVVSEGRFLRTALVPEGQDGRIWRLRGHAGGSDKLITFLNGPRVYSFSPHGMLVPDVSFD